MQKTVLFLVISTISAPLCAKIFDTSAQPGDSVQVPSGGFTYYEGKETPILTNAIVLNTLGNAVGIDTNDSCAIVMPERDSRYIYCLSGKIFDGIGMDEKKGTKPAHLIYKNYVGSYQTFKGTKPGESVYGVFCNGPCQLKTERK